jgi:hypothetical protein
MGMMDILFWTPFVILGVCTAIFVGANWGAWFGENR